MSKKFLKHFSVSLGIFAVLIWIIFLSLNLYTKHGQYLTVPNFTGKNINEVVGNLDYGDFGFTVIDSVFDLKSPKGMIVRQDPYPDSKVKSNRKIYLTIVSTNPENRQPIFGRPNLKSFFKSCQRPNRQQKNRSIHQSSCRRNSATARRLASTWRRSRQQSTKGSQLVIRTSDQRRLINNQKKPSSNSSPANATAVSSSICRAFLSRTSK